MALVTLDYLDLLKVALLRPIHHKIAMIGDNKHYGEIVAPENKMLEMARRAAELSNNGGGPEVLALLTQLLQAVRALDLTIDGDKITKKIVDKINEIAIKTGKSPLMI